MELNEEQIKQARIEDRVIILKVPIGTIGYEVTGRCDYYTSMIKLTAKKVKLDVHNIIDLDSYAVSTVTRTYFSSLEKLFKATKNMKYSMGIVIRVETETTALIGYYNKYGEEISGAEYCFGHS